MAFWREILTSGLTISNDWSDFLIARLCLALPLAKTDPGFLSQFGTQFYIWGSVAAGLGFVIFVHELGHFLAAKLFGVKVEKFYVGFDVPIRIGPIKFPRTLGKFRWGETEYGIGIIPLGGYVKMLGQDDDPRKAAQEADRIRVRPEDGEQEAEAPVELDPRSFPAKSVGQRMVIISAGVVVNIFTGFLFAAFAYGILGVSYTPAVVGGVTAGDPAFKAGIGVNGKVISIDGSEDDHKMHFQRMKMLTLTHGLANPDQAVTLRVAYPDKVREFELMTSSDPESPDQHLIGISSPAQARLNKDKNFIAEIGTPAAKVLEPADANAEILAIDDHKIEPDSMIGLSLTGPIVSHMVRQADQPVTLTLKRADGQERSVTIEPRRMKTLGFELGVGPISALVADGPAAEAGLKVGDQIIRVDGDKVCCAFLLPLQVSKKESAIQLSVRRGKGADAKELDFEISQKDVPSTLGPFSSQTGKISLDALGLAYTPTPIVESTSVEGLNAGDLIRNLTIQWPDNKIPEDLEELISEAHLKAITKGWETNQAIPLTDLITLLQWLPAGSKFDVLVERIDEGNKKLNSHTLTLSDGEGYWPTRGVIFAPVEFTHQAESLGGAVALGFREAKWRIGEVLHFLKLLVTGRVNRKHIGGPIKIAQIAASQAERGWSPLLLFLTMLSMNLAILNFLPIPALDGGHMVFLIAEAVLGRPVDEKLQIQLTMVGVLLLLSLMFFAFANDLFL